MALAYTLGAVLAVFIALKIQAHRNQQEPNYTDAISITNHIDGEDGIALHVGDPLKADAIQCNRLPRVITGRATATLTRTDPKPAEIVLLFADAGHQVAPGCATASAAVPLPMGVTAGTWELQVIVGQSGGPDQPDAVIVIPGIHVLP